MLFTLFIFRQFATIFGSYLSNLTDGGLQFIRLHIFSLVISRPRALSPPLSDARLHCTEHFSSASSENDEQQEEEEERGRWRQEKYISKSIHTGYRIITENEEQVGHFFFSFSSFILCVVCVIRHASFSIPSIDILQMRKSEINKFRSSESKHKMCPARAAETERQRRKQYK